MDTIPNNRWATLDIVKAATVPAMIIVHNAIWWLSFHPWAIQPAMTSWFHIIGALAFLVMLIPATAGAALYFYLGRHRGEQLPSFTSILQRAAILSIAGFLMNAFAFGFDTTFQWNVLQFFSLSMIGIFLFLRFANIYALSVFGVVVLVAAPIVRDAFGAFADIYPVAVLIGEPTGAHLWPFFPWFAVVVAGFVLAAMLTTARSMMRHMLLVLCSGAALVFLSGISGALPFRIDFTHVWGAAIFQPSTMHVIGIIGVGVVLFSGLHALFRNIKISRYGLIHAMSVGLFYVYILHMIGGFQLQRTVLQHSNNLALMVAAIAVQIVLAYIVGVLVTYVRERMHDH